MKRIIPLIAVAGFVILALRIPSYAENPTPVLTPRVFLPVVVKEYDSQPLTMTATGTATSAILPSASPTATETPTVTASSIGTVTPTETSTATPTLTPTATSTATASRTGTSTTTATATTTTTSTPSATPGPSVVMDYTAAGLVNTPQFTTRSSPWRLEFTANWTGNFTVYLKPSNEQVINQTVQAGRTYVTYVYGRTGTQYLSVTSASSTTQDWTLRVIDFPGPTPTATATSTTPSPTPSASATSTPTATATATPVPTVVLDYTGVGAANTPPFTVYASSWELEYTTTWSGYFSVSLEPSGYSVVDGQSVQAGQTYVTYIFGRTGTQYLRVRSASSTGTWTFKVTDYP